MKSLKARLLNSVRDNRGSVAPIFGLMAMPMMFAIGMALDQSRALYVKDRMQFALDSAALAAMATSAADVDAVGNKYFLVNFDTSDVTSYTVHLSKTNSGEVNATATASVAMTAGSLLGFNTVEVEASSVVEPQHEVVITEEETASTDNVPCIHVMDQSGSNTFDMQNGVNLDASSCIVHVRSNKSSYAMRETGGTNIEFKRIRVKGTGTYSSGLNHGDSVVTNNYEVTGNPYVSSVTDVVQNIAIGDCTTSNTGTSSSPLVKTGSVSPGTYCGNVKFQNATFGSGLYIIKSGSGSTKNGRLSFSGSIDGSAGVTFYLADTKSQLGTYDVSSGSVLTAPSSGTTRGLLIFEDSNRGSNWSWSLSTSNTNSWTGLVYLPSANVTMNITAWPTFNVSMAANQLVFNKIEEMSWTPYAWTPFNMSSPITLAGESDTTTTTTSSSSFTDIYLKQ
jgi:Flp pilus assembly protein TadG